MRLQIGLEAAWHGTGEGPPEFRLPFPSIVRQSPEGSCGVIEQLGIPLAFELTVVAGTVTLLPG